MHTGLHLARGLWYRNTVVDCFLLPDPSRLPWWWLGYSAT